MRHTSFRALIICLCGVCLNVMAAELPFPGAPEGAAAFGPMIGDHGCTMTYRGEGGELSETAACRWHWYYKFNGHMVQDDFYMFDDAGNVVWSGSTLRTWDLQTQRWNNMFLGAHDAGFGKMFHGEVVGDEVHLEVDGEDPDGRRHDNRIFFYAVADSKFRWRQERSYNGGESWELYVKVDITGPFESSGNSAD